MTDRAIATIRRKPGQIAGDRTPIVTALAWTMAASAVAVGSHVLGCTPTTHESRLKTLGLPRLL
jgi:hypothetical protein